MTLFRAGQSLQSTLSAMLTQSVLHGQLAWIELAEEKDRAFSMLATMLLAVDPRRLKVPREVLLGFAFAVSGGATLIVGDHISQEAHDVQSILFGSAVLVRPFDLKMVLLTGAVVMVLHLWWFRGVAFASFDPEAARVQGLPVRLLNTFVLLSVGAMVGVAARALGALPVFSFSILPPAIALSLGLRLPWAFAVAIVLGGAGGALGYVLAFFLEFPVGGTQTVLLGALFLLALIGRLAFQVGTRLRS